MAQANQEPFYIFWNQCIFLRTKARLLQFPHLRTHSARQIPREAQLFPARYSERRRLRLPSEHSRKVRVPDISLQNQKERHTPFLIFPACTVRSQDKTARMKRFFRPFLQKNSNRN